MQNGLVGIRAKDWNTMLISRRRTSISSLRLMLVMSRPSSSTEPAVTSMSRLSMRTMVDLPEPDSPMTTKISPSRMSKLASETPTVIPVFSKISSFPKPLRTISSARFGWGPKIL
ncbi:hypothetical protein ASALC70_03434 [Alcanivorax sp. ALC70]|nr:hypothetical protein ASALC70_03434 [Alcanivorax sp. ALC70]